MRSASFRRRIGEAFGAEGAAWLDGLPALVEAAAHRWDLELGRAFSASYGYVAGATRRVDGAPVVLKLAPPGALAREAAALAHLNGPGCVRLLGAAGGALLLERVVPGTPLAALVPASDDAATRAACGVIRALHDRPPPDPAAGWDAAAGGARTLARHRDAGRRGPVPAGLVDRALGLYTDLLASAAPPVVLHGDLHHGNVLRGGDGWVAVDPKGVLGEPAYEAGALLRNPYPVLSTLPDARRLTARRLDLLADELGHARERVQAWGFAQAVLAAVWSAEDHGELGEFGEAALACARLLDGA